MALMPLTVTNDELRDLSHYQQIDILARRAITMLRSIGVNDPWIRDIYSLTRPEIDAKYNRELIALGLSATIDDVRRRVIALVSN